MPTITLANVVTDAGTIATQLAPYIGVALAFVFGPRLLRMGISLIKGR